MHGVLVDEFTHETKIDNSRGQVPRVALCYLSARDDITASIPSIAVPSNSCADFPCYPILSSPSYPILTSALLAAALTGQTLSAGHKPPTNQNPSCGEETFTWKDTWKVIPDCVLKGQNVYYCGGSGATVIHKKTQIELRAGKVDSRVLVSCGDRNMIYRCRARQSDRFHDLYCSNSEVSSVNSIKE